MIDESKKGTSFLCQNVVKKKAGSQKKNNCLQKGVVRKKCLQKARCIKQVWRGLQENNGLSLMASVC